MSLGGGAYLASPMFVNSDDWHLVNEIWQGGKDWHGSHGEDVEGGTTADLVRYGSPAKSAHKITYKSKCYW